MSLDVDPDLLLEATYGEDVPCVEHDCPTPAVWGLRLSHSCYANPMLLCDPHHKRVTDAVERRKLILCGGCDQPITLIRDWRL